MPTKQQSVFVCSTCDSQFPKWTGRCANCGGWNTLSEQETKSYITLNVKPGVPKSLGEIESAAHARYSSGLREVDEILGGSNAARGFVPGSLVLLGGDPGIGKSTLALQIALQAADKNLAALYVSGEESLPQIKLRAERISANFKALQAISETNLDVIIATVEKVKPTLLVIDSVQTMYSEQATGVAGGPAQVSFAAAKLLEAIKPIGTTTLVIGHVTKEGNLAGPRMLEHMVDVVLYLEGERSGQFRILRCVKNRFGSTNEVGVFEMQSAGLRELTNPSAFFLSQRASKKPGSCVTCTLEGSRSLLLEIQALVARSEFNYPKRAATGFDTNRLQLLIAVLSRSLKISLSSSDVYVGVAGGYRISDPASDLAVCMSIVSSSKNIALPEDMVVLGEVGLSGEIRKVGNIEKRLKEAEKLGFKRAIVPVGTVLNSQKIKTLPVQDLQEAVRLVSSK